jgi:DsbC/DsbD-like thiol-disulfide interchange protein
MRNPIEVLRFFSRFMLVLILLPEARASAASIPHGTVDFVAENQWITPGRQTYVGLNFRLEKGWHIYWINPGDSGQPPQVEWHLPAGLSAGEIEWPAPRRLGTSTIVDFGYDDAVMLLVPMHASSTLRPDQAVKLDAGLKVLVCREICIPGKAQISLSLPINSMPPEADARSSELFNVARKSLPRKAPRHWEFNVSDQKDSFVLTAKLDRQMTRATFFPVEESQVDNSAAQKVVPMATGFQLTLRKSDQLLKPIKRLKGVLEFSSNQAYLIDVAVTDNHMTGQTGVSILGTIGRNYGNETVHRFFGAMRFGGPWSSATDFRRESWAARAGLYRDC